MAAMANLPVFMRLGTSGPMHAIGSLDLPVDGDGWLTFDRTALAAALRAAADEIENPTVDEEVPDAAAHG
ncbi:hypothetical protein [Streptomyces parvulus]|uniref:hypothetical protein n=1 Tax=Streptomyces parvulus TaxID=146923 RepID=UPI00371D4795